MISPETSRKFRLFSRGINARRAPFSMAICNGSERVYTDFMLPWMLRSPRITNPGATGVFRRAETIATRKAISRLRR